MKFFGIIDKSHAEYVQQLLIILSGKHPLTERIKLEQFRNLHLGTHALLVNIQSVLATFWSTYSQEGIVTHITTFNHKKTILTQRTRTIPRIGIFQWNIK